MLTPWNVALLLADVALGTGSERQIHDRLKQALCHPDNHLGAALLLAGLAIPADEPAAAQDYFFNRLIPAALEFYEPLTVSEPAIGTGVLVMACASVLPAWAVQFALVRFVGGDIDPVMVAASRTACRLYGLNGYALELEAAVAEALTAYQERTGTPAQLISPAQVIQAVYQNGDPPAATSGQTGPSFEQMYRAAARPQPPAVEPAGA